MRKLWMYCAVLTAAVMPVITVAYLAAQPGGTGTGVKYGAIAFSRSTRAHGYSYNYNNRREAVRRALSECNRRSQNRDCVNLVWFRNACAALAVGDTGYGAAWARSRGEAEQKALSNCRKHSDNCTVVRWVCTSR